MADIVNKGFQWHFSQQQLLFHPMPVSPNHVVRGEYAMRFRTRTAVCVMTDSTVVTVNYSLASTPLQHRHLLQLSARACQIHVYMAIVSFTMTVMCANVLKNSLASYVSIRYHCPPQFKVFRYVIQIHVSTENALKINRVTNAYVTTVSMVNCAK